MPFLVVIGTVVVTMQVYRAVQKSWWETLAYCSGASLLAGGLACVADILIVPTYSVLADNSGNLIFSSVAILGFACLARADLNF